MRTVAVSIRTGPLASRLALLFIENTAGRHLRAVFVSSITQQVIEAWAWHEMNRHRVSKNRTRGRDKDETWNETSVASEETPRTTRRTNATRNGEQKRRDDETINGTTGDTRNETTGTRKQ